MSPSYESIKSNVQTLKWAEETYFCIMNSVKKPTNVRKDSLPLSTQAFNRRYSYLYKKSHLLHFSKICLYLSLRFNELKTTKHARFWFLFLTLCTSLTAAETLSHDFHFPLSRDSYYSEINEPSPDNCRQSTHGSDEPVHVSGSLSTRHRLLRPEQSVSLALGVWHPGGFRPLMLLL